jgi:UDP-N-acetylmuramoyl-L-alanyl-D-glutamate--2,6-diaminopimelate ligase
MMLKRIIRTFLPAAALDAYHRALAVLATWRYGHPSRKMVVIGVTGTNGKSTTCNFIAAALEAGGHRVGLTTTVNFRIAGREWLNDSKMTMLGRFRLQKLLAEMVRAGCTHAVIETSSEGIKQHRHAGIAYDVAVFTNLTPEHLESHGGFENYKEAKGELFASLARTPVKRLDGKEVKKVSVVNLADQYAPYFLSFAANKKYGFLTERTKLAEQGRGEIEWPFAVVKAMDVRLDPAGVAFSVRDVPFSLSMPGLFNVENAMAAVAVGLSQGVALESMAAVLAAVPGVPGRLERIDEGQQFVAMVDYAPEPASLGKLYEVVAGMAVARVIHVLGSTGGGRDRDRRPVLGSIAGKRAAAVIVTNEDPYDDEPMAIIDEVAAGAIEAGKRDGVDLFRILDRRDAIRKAVAMAGAGDLVLVTGKGAEQRMAVADGKKLPWDDRTELRNAIRERIAAREL